MAAEVAKVKWWMRHYGSPTPKRHYGYSNSGVVMRLDLGKLYTTQRAPRSQRIRTADVYVDRHGTKRYKGNKNLRSTETLDLDVKTIFFIVCGIGCTHIQLILCLIMIITFYPD